jgi:fatty-acid desaturase
MGSPRAAHDARRAPTRSPGGIVIADNIQRTEGPRTVIVRAVIGHLALLGVFFVPVTKELLTAALIGFFIRVFAIEGGVHRYFSHRSL